MATILIVDDNAKIRRLMDIYLRREGFQTLQAADGGEVLPLLESQAVDLIIADVMMPRLVGPKWEAKDLRLELELDEGTFEGYEPLLSQVWANFIDNAVKFSSVGGSIAATLSCVDGRGSFCLRDEGGGSPPMIKNIF